MKYDLRVPDFEKGGRYDTPIPYGAVPDTFALDLLSERRRHNAFSLRVEKKDSKQARENHEHHERNLDQSDNVLYPDAKFHEAAMHYTDCCQQANGHQLRLVWCCISSSRKKNVFAENDAVGCSEAKHDRLDGNKSSRKISWPAIGEFEIHFVSTRSWKHGSIFETD